MKDSQNKEDKLNLMKKKIEEVKSLADEITSSIEQAQLPRATFQMSRDELAQSLHKALLNTRRKSSLE